MSGFITALPHYAMYGLVNFLMSRGVTVNESLAVLQCKLTDLTTDDKHFSLTDYERLRAYARNRLDCNNLGFEHGKAFYPGEWGLLGHIVMASENLVQALYFQKRYQCLMSALGRAYHVQEDGIVTMRWLSDSSATDNSIEQVITAWVAFAFANTLSDEKPLSIHFVHQPLANEQQYQDFFGCEVHFKANFNGIVIKEASLHLPLINQNEMVLNVLCCHAENLLAEKRATASLGIINQYIIEMLPNRVPKLDDIAQHLGLSTRQLQRKFQKEQTNLTSLLEDIRKSLAISYLSQTDHKLMYISMMLGYSEQSAFQRAFRRWTGKTPQSFRLQPTLTP